MGVIGSLPPIVLPTGEAERSIMRLGARLATGSRSDVFEVGADAVAKVPLRSTPDSWILEEARYADAVCAVGAPVPRLLGIELLDGRQVSIYERIRGGSMLEHLRGEPSAVAAHAATLAHLHASSFALSPPPVVLPRLVDRLTSKIRAAAARQGIELLSALDVVPDDRRIVVCHGDLHPGNVILAATGPVVIDWFDASCGSPAADVARTLVLLSPECHGPSGVTHLPGATSRRSTRCARPTSGSSRRQQASSSPQSRRGPGRARWRGWPRAWSPTACCVAGGRRPPASGDGGGTRGSPAPQR